MTDRSYVNEFKKMGFGMFVHFGLYSVLGKGEWAYDLAAGARKQYAGLMQKFKVKKNWARDLARLAKRSGCKYINITTRHHDGFSLYDTCGLNDYDAPHSAAGRDLIAEFCSACEENNIVPFFYHTLLDWSRPEFETDFPAYIDYLIESVKLLCKNYGKIGGLWFDGMWSKPHEDWQEDRLYSEIRRLQPAAMIINNTGLSELGKVGHPEIDGVTFERGAPAAADNTDRPRAGEMCQVLNDHWGYARQDVRYKSLSEIIENLVDCRAAGCNFLLNTGLMGNGSVNPADAAMFLNIGKWIKYNKNIIYDLRPCGIEAENAVVMRAGEEYYAAVKGVPMAADINVQRGEDAKKIKIHAPVKSAVWADSGRRAPVKNGTIVAEPFAYGTSMDVRFLKLKLK